MTSYEYAGVTPVSAMDRVQIMDPVNEKWMDGVVLETLAAQFSVGIPATGKVKLERRLYYLYVDKGVTWTGANDVRIRTVR